MNLKTNSFILLGTFVVAGTLVGAVVIQSSDAITLEEYNQTQVDPAFLDDAQLEDQLDPVENSPAEIVDEPFDDSDVVDPSDSDFSFVDDEVVVDKSYLEEPQVRYPVAPITPEEEAEAEKSWLELSTNFALEHEGKTWITISPDGFTKCIETGESWICHTKGGHGVTYMQVDFVPEYLMPDVPQEVLQALGKVHPLGEVQPYEVTLIDDQWCLVGYNTKIIQAYDPTDGSVKSYPLMLNMDSKLTLSEAQDISN